MLAVKSGKKAEHAVPAKASARAPASPGGIKESCVQRVSTFVTQARRPTPGYPERRYRYS